MLIRKIGWAYMSVSFEKSVVCLVPIGNQEAEAAVTLGHRSLQPVGSSESEQDDVEEDLSEEDIEVNDAPSTHQMPTNLEEQEALALKLLS